MCATRGGFLPTASYIHKIPRVSRGHYKESGDLSEVGQAQVNICKYCSPGPPLLQADRLLLNTVGCPENGPSTDQPSSHSSHLN